MSKLYTALSELYEAMYATFIDYEEEYQFYSEILKNFQKDKVLEIGSGTGSMSKLFTENGFTYQGLDISVDMLKIAKEKNPDGSFIEGDMRNFKLEQPVESALITGRAVSYLLKNEDVNAALKTIHQNLKPRGILCFDFIDANRFIPEIIEEERIIHKASLGTDNYIRESKWRLNMQHGMDLVWDSKYSKQVGKQLEEVGTDTEVVRPFTKNEIEIFLAINDFEVLEIFDRDNYAFPTYVVVAEKKLPKEKRKSLK